MYILAKNNIWDTVYTSVNVKRKLIKSFFCKHKDTVKYKRTDHRSGPGFMSDSYEGIVCVNCGRIVKEIRVF
jgi:hypothetical protein